MQLYNYSFWIAGGLALCYLLTTSSVQAQIVPDETLPVNSTVTSGCTVCKIEGGTVRGSNLFHSFREFSVPTGGEAVFNNDLQIKNIFSRVTGSSVSDINGVIRANGTASLFLLNPSGIIFGPKAELQIGGSLVASTARSLLFKDGTQFSATNPQTSPLLTINVPIGLQFGQTIGKIRNQSQTTELINNIPGVSPFPNPVGLKVEPGRTLALVGGNVLIEDGTMRAPAGRIEIGSVAGPGLVSLNPIPEGWALGYEGMQSFQDIQLSQALVAASGSTSGDIHVQGRQVELKASRITSYNDREPDGGAISVKAEQLILQNGSQIQVGTYGSGRAGDLTVTSDSIDLIGRADIGPSGLFAQTSRGLGRAGDLTINTNRLTVRDGAQVATSTFGPGQGGTLTVNALDSVTVSGSSVDGVDASGLLAQTDENATGDGGNLIVDTGRLIVQDGATVSVGAVGNSTGRGGELSITASESVEVMGAGTARPSTLLAESRGTGAAGKLTIESGRLTVRNGAQVTVSATGGGAAGDLQINAHSLLLDKQGALRAETAAGEGNIRLEAQNILLRRNSNITTDATNEASGGNIKIRTDVLAALENSDITANSANSLGGRVTINAQGIFGTEFRDQLTPLSDITASGGGPELSGTVEINTPDVDPSQGLVELPAELVDVSNSIATGCAVGGENEFIITGRGGLPPNPYEPLDSSEVWRDVHLPRELAETSDRVSRTSTSPTMTPGHIVEAQGWIVNENGNVELVAKAPTAISQDRCDLRSKGKNSEH